MIERFYETSDNYANCMYSPSGEIIRSNHHVDGSNMKQCVRIENAHPYGRRGLHKSICPECVEKEEPIREVKEPECYRFQSLEHKRAYLADVLRGKRELKLCDKLKEPKCHRLPNINPTLAYKNNLYKDTCVKQEVNETYEPVFMQLKQNEPYLFDRGFKMGEVCYDMLPSGAKSNQYYDFQQDYDKENNYY
jgi:hypothetical protein